jgi:hypothetical protein
MMIKPSNDSSLRENIINCRRRKRYCNIFIFVELKIPGFLALKTFFLRISKLFYPNINTKLGPGKDYYTPLTIIDFNT